MRDSSKAEVKRSRISLDEVNAAVLHPKQSLGAASYVTGIHTVAERLQFEESALKRFVEREYKALSSLTGAVPMHLICAAYALMFNFDNIEHCHKILDYLVSHGRFYDALLFVDSRPEMEDLNVDFLVQGIIVTSPSVLKLCWGLLSRVQNITVTSTLALNIVSQWEADTAVEALLSMQEKLKQHLVSLNLMSAL